MTYSYDFPRTVGAIDDTLIVTLAGRYDGFVSKFNFSDIYNQVQNESKHSSEFHVDSIYPNPFNLFTSIEFSLPYSARIKLMVYSINGQRVYMMQTEKLPVGLHRFHWNGKDNFNNNVSSGVYLIKLDNGMQSLANKVLLLK